MKQFNISVKDNRDHKWYSVDFVSFRFWKNHPSDGVNEIRIIKDDAGSVPFGVEFIEEISFNIW